MKTRLSILLLLPMATAHGATIVWDGSNDQFWGKGNNWTGGPVPTAADDVVLDDTAFGFTVNLGSESRAANSLTIDSATAYTIENQIDTPSFTLSLGDVTVLSGTDHVIHPPVLLASDAIYSVATGADLTLEGSISGTNPLAKTGGGTLILDGLNTFTGGTVIHEGAVFLLPNDDDFNLSFQNSTVTLNVGDGLQHDALSEVHIGALAGSGDYDANGSYVEVGGNNASTTYSGNLTDEFLALGKVGTGTWTLAGSDLLMSEFVVGDGAVVFDGAGGNINALRGLDRPVTFQNGADVNVVNLGGGSITIDRSSATVALITPFGAGDTIAISDPDGGTALTFNSASDREIASTITDHISGPGSILKTGAGDLSLTSENTHSGTTTISGGRIVLGNALVLQNSTVAIGLDDGLDLNGHNATLGGLAGGGDLALGTNTITVGGNDNSTSYDGVLSGTGGLIKEGTGTLSLGGDYSFTGDTVINEGAVFLASDADGFNYSLQSSTVHINVDNGLQHDSLPLMAIGALEGGGDYDAKDAFIEVGGNNASTTFSGDIIGVSATFLKEGAGTWTLQGSDLAIPHLLVGSGAVIFDGAGGSVTSLSTVKRPITFQNGADINVGYLSSSSIAIDSGAALTVTGDFSMSKADTLIRTVGDASTLDVTGTATLAGTIKVHFPEDYSPPVGEPLTLCTYGSMGEGDPVLDSSALPAGYVYELEVISDGATPLLALVIDYANTAQGFRLQYGLAADGSEDALDKSGNGIANILYYVYGLGDPAAVDIDRSRLPSIAPDSDTCNIVFTYVRPSTNDTGLSIGVITSDNLAVWFTPDELGLDHLPVSETTEPLDGDHSTATQVYTVRIDEDRRFYRLKVGPFVDK